MTETTDSLVCSTAVRREIARLTLDRDPLDGERHDLARALVALGLRGGFDIPDGQRRLALGLVLHGGDKLGPGLVGGQAGDALQLGPLGRVGVREVFRPVLERGPAADKGLSAFLKAAALVVKALLALADPLLTALQVAAELAYLVLDEAELLLGLVPPVRRQLGRQLGGLDGRLLGRRGGAAEDLVGLSLRAGADLLRVGLRLLGELAGVGGQRETAGRTAQDDDEHAERECQGNQADYQQRDCAAHGHTFRSVMHRNSGVVWRLAACGAAGTITRPARLTTPYCREVKR
jgi:hypothetical protein